MKIAVNDSAVTRGDIDFSAFENLGETKFFGEISTKKLYALARDCEAIVVNKVFVDKAFLDNCPEIRYVGVFATGYNVIDVEECKKRGIVVTNVPDYSTYAVAQHVFALLLNLYGSTEKYISSVAAGDWTRSKTFCYFPWEIKELCGKTFGILGYGNIGKRVAAIASAFGAEPIICTRTPPQNCPYALADFETLLKKSDILSLHCPLTPATSRIIDGGATEKMKDGATLINTARGGLLDEFAVRRALDIGKLAGAGLDVVDVEPMKADNPLLNAPNCIITPHIAWAPRETRQRLVDTAAENLRKFIEGEKVENRVN